MPKEKILLWAGFREFVTVCPNDVYYWDLLQICRGILGINVEFYELVPNMETMDKWKKTFD